MLVGFGVVAVLLIAVLETAPNAVIHGNAVS